MAESSTMNTTKPTRGRPKGTSAKYLIICKAFDDKYCVETVVFKQAARAQKWLDSNTHRADSFVFSLVQLSDNKRVAQFTFRAHPTSDADRFNLAAWFAYETQGK